MHYCIYKVINKINGKYYIGMHKTVDLNDGYMGSGKLIKRAIKKYGLENFEKRILHVFDNEEDMKNKEKELVIFEENSYNLCDGGLGGFGYINRVILSGERRLEHNRKCSPFKRTDFNRNHGKYNSEKRSKNALLLIAEGRLGFKGRKHSVESRTRISEKNSISQLSNKNSQYGTCWITNGKENKKVKKEELDSWILLGYYKGRIIRRPFV